LLGRRGFAKIPSFRASFHYTFTKLDIKVKYFFNIRNIFKARSLHVIWKSNIYFWCSNVHDVSGLIDVRQVNFRVVCSRVARFFSVHYVKQKWGKKYTKLTAKYTKRPLSTYLHQMASKYRMVIKYTKVFHSKAFNSIPKLEFLVWKYTIWQPWSVAEYNLKSPVPALDCRSSEQKLGQLWPRLHS
jgi:hypothetical protein